MSWENKDWPLDIRQNVTRDMFSTNETGSIKCKGLINGVNNITEYIKTYTWFFITQIFLNELLCGKGGVWETWNVYINIYMFILYKCSYWDLVWEPNHLCKTGRTGWWNQSDQWFPKTWDLACKLTFDPLPSFLWAPHLFSLSLSLSLSISNT